MAGTLKVDQKEAARLLKEMGNENAEGLSRAKLTNMLKKVPTQIEEWDDDEEVDLSKRSIRLANKLSDALEEKIKIVVISDDGEEDQVATKSKRKTRHKATAEKASKKSAKKKSSKTRPPTKRAPTEYDKWGNRVGSEAALINSKITRQWQDVDKLKADRDFRNLSTGRVASHLRYLLRRDIIRVKDGRVKAIKDKASL